ncbi:MAG: hypothetical protein ACQKBT_08035, partial [Puniceicoccales bacterium]
MKPFRPSSLYLPPRWTAISLLFLSGPWSLGHAQEESSTAPSADYRFVSDRAFDFLPEETTPNAGAIGTVDEI